MTLRIVLNSDVFCPGETVEGRVHVTGGGGSRSLEVLLRFIEQSPDYRTVARTVSGAVFHSGELETGQVVDFSIELPADALPNASSEHAELYWSSRSAPTSSASTAAPAKRSRSWQTANGRA